MAKILTVYNRFQAGDYENGNGGKRRVSRLSQFILATLQMKSRNHSVPNTMAAALTSTSTVLHRNYGHILPTNAINAKIVEAGHSNSSTPRWMLVRTGLTV